VIELAALNLLSAASEDGPLLGVSDDAQWLDRSSAQALAFVARRLLAEPVALLFDVFTRLGVTSRRELRKALPTAQLTPST
jgi:hypothetical protein